MTLRQTYVDALYSARPDPQTHAIIAAMLGAEPKTSARYVGKAIVTSDGFVLCNFVGSDGVAHHGAFVGSMAELERNVKDVAAAVKVPAAEVDKLISSWIATDYRY
jgi:hypothetical protein